MTQGIESARRWTIVGEPHLGHEFKTPFAYLRSGILEVNQEVEVIEAAPVLAEIERLKKALEKAKEQRNSCFQDYKFHRNPASDEEIGQMIAQDEAEIQEILEGK